MRIAVVTGASAGIGREFVYAIDREERFDEIWVIARRRERLEELAGKCRNRIRPVTLDLSDLKNIEEYRALLEREQPEIALLVNAAGCGVFGPFAEKDLEKQLKSATLNSLALTAMCHTSLPYMKAGDRIVNMGRLHPLCGPLVRSRGGGRAGTEGPQKAQDGLHPGPSRAPPGAPGEVFAGEARHGYLVQTAGYSIVGKNQTPAAIRRGRRLHVYSTQKTRPSLRGAGFGSSPSM